MSSPYEGPAQGPGDGIGAGNAAGEVSPDVGLQVVRYVYGMMKIGRQWSLWSERGFTWWGGELAQRIWADPCFQDENLETAQVHARTDLLKDFAGSDDQLQELALLLRQTSLSGLIRDP